MLKLSVVLEKATLLASFCYWLFAKKYILTLSILNVAIKIGAQSCLFYCIVRFSFVASNSHLVSSNLFFTYLFSHMLMYCL